MPRHQQLTVARHVQQHFVANMVRIYAVVEGEGSLSEAPGCIQAVIAKFEDVFGEPTGLPPRRACDHRISLIPRGRACDHRISLIPRGQPVRIRPYRNKPEHKDEIERQIEELLRTCVIQRSFSPFASPMILVNKKECSWRLRIHYRKLNALTCVAKFLVPIDTFPSYLLFQTLLSLFWTLICMI
ncbi:retrotransposon unclassified [Hordeum vulgare]|nr:retrotransposon unclassified [Hordeum vulgare]